MGAGIIVEVGKTIERDEEEGIFEERARSGIGHCGGGRIRLFDLASLEGLTPCYCTALWGWT